MPLPAAASLDQRSTEVDSHTALQIRKRMARIWRGKKYRVEAVAGYTHKNPCGCRKLNLPDVARTAPPRGARDPER